MHFDPYIALAGLIVGFTVGLTGMGGGALMTPILVLVFKVQPLAAVSSDLVASFIMKPVGASVHARRGTVNWGLVRWLVIGSVPAAFAGVFVLRAIGGSGGIEDRLKIALGAALLLASGTIVAKGFLQARRVRKLHAQGVDVAALVRAPVEVKKVRTILIGAIGGLVVGMTSVGSGSLIIVMLMLLYPMLSASSLVGTDLMQAIPLVGAAALGHILYGDFQVAITASLLIGSLPGVYLGARYSSRAPDRVIRPALVFVLLASGLKLVGLSTVDLGWTMLGIVLLVPPLWGAIDAASRPREEWERAGRRKGLWVGLQAAGAPFAIGLAAAIVYFATARPELMEVAGAEAPDLLVPVQA